MKRKDDGCLVDAFLVPEVVDATLLETGSLFDLLLLLDLLDHPLGGEEGQLMCFFFIQGNKLTF